MLIETLHPAYIIAALLGLIALTFILLWMRESSVSAELRGKYDIATDHTAALSDELESVKADNLQLVQDVSQAHASAAGESVRRESMGQLVDRLAARAVAFDVGDLVTWKNGPKHLSGEIIAAFGPNETIMIPDEWKGMTVNAKGSAITKTNLLFPSYLVATPVDGDTSAVNVYKPVLQFIKRA